MKQAQQTVKTEAQSIPQTPPEIYRTLHVMFGTGSRIGQDEPILDPKTLRPVALTGH